MLCLGEVAAGTTIYIPFSTYAGATGASVTMTGLAVTDIEIYKNGSVTQRASDAGYALLDGDGIDFDGVTGIHGFSVDLSDNTDTGFYAVGSWYWVVVSAVTVDSQTVNFIAAVFRIKAAETIAGTPKADVAAWLGTAAATPTTAGVPEVDLTHVAGAAVSTTTAQLGVNVVQVSADATAADTLELFAEALDQTTGQIDSGTFLGAAINSTTLDATASAEIAVAVWSDAPENYGMGDLTFGGSIRRIESANVASAASVDDATATTTEFDTTLTHATGFWNDTVLVFTSGALNGQARIVLDYNNTGGHIMVEEPFTSAPANTDEFVVLSGHAHPITQIAGAVWDLATSGHTTASTFGAQAKTVIDAIIAMFDDARTEPGQGAPPVNPDLATKIDYLYKAWRNKKEQTATEFTLYADDGTTADQQATVSDDGTTTAIGEMGTGA